jgi:hypothetical protein
VEGFGVTLTLTQISLFVLLQVLQAREQAPKQDVPCRPRFQQVPALRAIVDGAFTVPRRTWLSNWSTSACFRKQIAETSTRPYHVGVGEEAVKLRSLSAANPRYMTPTRAISLVAAARSRAVKTRQTTYR